MFRIPVLKPPSGSPAQARPATLDDLLDVEERTPAGSADSGSVEMAIPATQAVDYAPGDAGGPGEAGLGPYARWYRQLAYSLAFPARPGDLLSLLIVWIPVAVGVAALNLFAGAGVLFGSCLGFLVWIVTQCWYMAYQLNVVVGAAADEDELPNLTLERGWADVGEPLLKMLAANALTWLPALVFLLLVHVTSIVPLGTVGNALASGGPWAGVTALPIPVAMVFLALVLMGYFVWPMLVLIVAVEGVMQLLRIDLVARTIFKSFLPYANTVAIVYLTLGLSAVCGMVVEQARGAGAYLPIIVDAGLLLVEVYVTIVAMRAIGSYYYHFRDRFAWDWG